MPRQCLLLANSGLFGVMPRTSALPPLLGINGYGAGCPLRTHRRHGPCLINSSTDRSLRCGRMWSRSAQRSSATAATLRSRWPRFPCRGRCSRKNPPTDRRPADEASTDITAYVIDAVELNWRTPDSPRLSNDRFIALDCVSARSRKRRAPIPRPRTGS